MVLLRQAQGLSQGALAKRAGLTQSMLSRIELGRSDTNLRVLRRVAVSLGSDQAAVLALVDRSLKKAEALVRQGIPVFSPPGDWVGCARAQVGTAGLAGLLTFATAAVLAEPGSAQAPCPT